MPEIDRESSIPLYYQLKTLLKQQIRNGKFEPGDRIPTEQELCERYGISRTPVRQALTELTHEGLLKRQPGRGTFVHLDLQSTTEEAKRSVSAVVPDERWVSPLETAAAIWNQAHPNQPVALEVLVTGLPQLRFKLRAAIARGKAPTFSLIDSVWLAEFAEADFLLPLSEIDPDWVEGTYRSDFFPALVRGNSYADRVYAVQAETDMALLWYRRDWFEAEGLEPPRTWEEFVTTARHFQSNRYGLGRQTVAFPAGLNASETGTYQLLPFLWSAGGDIFRDGHIALDSKPTRKTLQLFHDLVHTHEVAAVDVTSYQWDDPLRLFAAGQVAMATGGSYESTLIKQEADWDEAEFRERAGFVPIPAGPGGSQTTAAGGMAYAVYRQSKHPQLALALLKIVTGSEAMRQFCLETGQNPPRISVARSLDPETDWFLAATSKMLYQARTRPAIPQYAKVSEQFRAMFENVIMKRLTISEAVTRATEIISALTGLPRG